jgi:hypothetical protein
LPFVRVRAARSVCPWTPSWPRQTSVIITSAAPDPRPRPFLPVWDDPSLRLQLTAIPDLAVIWIFKFFKKLLNSRNL